MTYHRAGVLSLLLGLVIAGAVACGGGEKADTVSTENNPAPAATPTEVAAPTPPPPTAEPPPPTSDKLQGHLLKLEDMPSGWTTSLPGTNAASDAQRICNRSEPSTTIKPAATAMASFQKSDFGPFLVHGLSSLSGANAKKIIDDVADSWTACSEWTLVDAKGVATTWRLSRLSFPKLGDETFAVRMSTKDIPLFGSAQVDMIYWRRGNVVSYLGYAVMGPAAAGESPLEDMARKVDDRLKTQVH